MLSPDGRGEQTSINLATVLGGRSATSAVARSRVLVRINDTSPLNLGGRRENFELISGGKIEGTAVARGIAPGATRVSFADSCDGDWRWATPNAPASAAGWSPTTKVA